MGRGWYEAWTRKATDFRAISSGSDTWALGVEDAQDASGKPVLVKRRYLVLTAILIVAAFLAGAFLGPRVFKSPAAHAEERWYFSPRSDYTMTIEGQCFCPWGSTYTVTVRGNEPIRIESAGHRLSLRAARAGGTPLTVDNLFTMVHALTANYGAQNVDVTYDPKWGYPLTIATGGRADAVDDELSLAVTSFQEGR